MRLGYFVRRRKLDPRHDNYRDAVDIETDRQIEKRAPPRRCDLLKSYRSRGVVPLALAETARRRKAYRSTTTPAACPCSMCQGDWTATGCRTRSLSSKRSRSRHASNLIAAGSFGPHATP